MIDQTSSFLIFNDLPTAQTRSAQMATRMGCAGGTLFWYWIIPLTNNTFAMVVDASGEYGTKPGPTALSQLTPSEIAALVPFLTVQPLLPPIQVLS
jgi:hypothetical protein